MRANDGEAVFIREFSLIRRDHLPEDFLQDTHPPQKPEDPVSDQVSCDPALWFSPGGHPGVSSCCKTDKSQKKLPSHPIPVCVFVCVYLVCV